tara:strand:- start:578 stop:949 length:372 start_codon:yes stop_codon:yes gene_type:complete
LKLQVPDFPDGGDLYIDYLRFDAVLVTTASVWKIFTELRESFGGDVNCNAFVELCYSQRRMAMKHNNPAAAQLWKAVHGFGLSYSISFVSAVDVDGVLFRENNDIPASLFPADNDLVRVSFVP